MSQDKELTCRDCGSTFVFTAGEQTFFQERGFSEPVRCKTCRDVKKAQRADHGFSDSGRQKRNW